MATIDQQFVEYIVKTLVNNPDKVKIDRTIDEKGVLLSLEVDPEDVGRIIGRRGATAQSIRTLLRALGTKNDARYNLKIINNDGFEGKEKADDTAADDSFASDEEAAEETSELAKKTRQELADLDDLDI
ncbi:MAG: KH domain-containing protein [Candidatus Saccharibacteria bacterium]|nr:KH domain-containing protein [Candidatus Saccharibacteria bacterium]